MVLLVAPAAGAASVPAGGARVFRASRFLSKPASRGTAGLPPTAHRQPGAAGSRTDRIDATLAPPAEAVGGRFARAAANQRLFRDLNTREETLDEALAPQPSYAWQCECDDPDCNERIPMTRTDYQRLRAHGNRFAVTPDHAGPADDIIDRYDKYLVVARRSTELPARHDSSRPHPDSSL